jgi:hypothetical protein
MQVAIENSPPSNGPTPERIPMTYPVFVFTNAPPSCPSDVSMLKPQTLLNSDSEVAPIPLSESPSSPSL